MIRVFLSLAIVAGTLVGAFALNGSVPVLFDFLSFVFVTFMIAGGTLWSFSVGQLKEAFGSYFGGGTLEEETALRAHAVFTRIAELSVSAGFAGTLVGIMLILRNLDDPSALGPAMAVAILTVLYGVVLGELVFRSAARDALSRADVFDNSRGKRGSSSIYAAMAAFLMAIVCLQMILLAFAEF